MRLAEKYTFKDLNVGEQEVCQQASQVHKTDYLDGQVFERHKVRDAFEDVFFEMSRGLPLDGTNGRPLGNAIPLERWKQFAVDNYSGITADFVHSLLMRLVPG